MEKPREIAARILTDPSGSYIETLLERAWERVELKPEDRRFLQELVYGVVRWQLTLDWLIHRKTGGRPQKPLVQNLLRLALYQMFWLDRVPSYAAVNETVEICKQHNFPQQAKFINAVLRGYGREAAPTRDLLASLRGTNLSLAFSHPDWLCRRWTEHFGRDATLRLLEWNNASPPTFARVNTLQGSSDDLRKAWAEEGVAFEEGTWDWVSDGSLFKLLKHPSLVTLPSFQKGLFYVQDPSTLLAVNLLDPKPDESILDVCAAPGGKTTYAAQKMQNQGRILAEDLNPERLQMVLANATRLGVTCIRTQAAEEPTFDRVLVDAPCSNTGVMRRRVELRWRIQPEEIPRLAQEQIRILNAAGARCRPGGTLVYSTCSLEREENSEVVRQFLAANGHFHLETERALTPMEQGTDGAYCAKLRRAQTP